jgi:hypothetical protein
MRKLPVRMLAVLEYLTHGWIAMLLRVRKPIGEPEAEQAERIRSISSIVNLDRCARLVPAVWQLAQTRNLAERAIFYSGACQTSSVNLRNKSPTGRRYNRKALISSTDRRRGAPPRDRKSRPTGECAMASVSALAA